MFNILKLNSIDNAINNIFDDKYNLTNQFDDPDAILVRSYKMHDMKIGKRLLAVARAGAGVNNIPINKLKDLGIPVFNAPGANANAVKELVIASLINSSRNVVKATQWTRNLDTNDKEFNKKIEDGKKQFAGTEIKGKILGVIGIGAVGKLVASAASEMGMIVYGNDKHNIVPERAQLFTKVLNINEIIAESDYLTIHIPYSKETHHLIDAEKIKKMKDGVILLNFARGELFDNQAVLDGVKSGKIKKYYSDFPIPKLYNCDNIIFTPHLGASTEEAETQCAVMAASELKDFIENGNITNSVNFPSLSLERTGGSRITIFAKESDNILKNLFNEISNLNLQIKNVVSQSFDNYIYAIVDILGTINDEQKEKLKKDKYIKLRIL